MCADQTVDRRLSILLVAPGLWHAPEVAEGARRLGHEVILAGAARRHRSLQLPLRAARGAANRSRTLGPVIHVGLGAAARMLVRQEHDLVISWSSFALPFALTRAEARKVLLVRGSNHIRRQALLLGGAPGRHGPSQGMVFLEQLEYRRAGLVTVPTPEIAADPFWVEGGSRRPLVAPYGFPPVRHASARAQRKHAQLIFGGALGFRKGADRLVSCLGTRPRGVSAFTVFGHVQVPSLDLPKWWSCVGLQPRQAWLEALDSSDVLLLPSREEGMARVGLEAISAGVPVIATPEAGLGVWLRAGAGLELDSEDWTRLGLENAITVIMSQREKYRDATISLARSWTWTDHVSQLLQGIDEVLAGTGGHRRITGISPGPSSP